MGGFRDNRVVRDTGAEYPIIQAPMAWIARSRLVSAISASGAFGLLETSARDLAASQREYDAIRAITDRPFGINLAIKFLRGDEDFENAVLDWALDGRVGFVTTSAGDPRRYIGRIRDAGVKVYHAVPTLEAALKAEDAGIDGLVVEGAESGGIRGPGPVPSFVLLQAVRRRTALPIVAAGGIADGIGMAGAFALGAEGVAMGTRFVASSESPVHGNYKNGIVDARLDGTVLLSGPGPAARVLRTELAEALARGEQPPGAGRGKFTDLYVEGRLDSALGSAGISSALIDGVLPVGEIVEQMVATFRTRIASLAALGGD